MPDATPRRPQGNGPLPNDADATKPLSEPSLRWVDLSGGSNRLDLTAWLESLSPDMTGRHKAAMNSSAPPLLRGRLLRIHPADTIILLILISFGMAIGYVLPHRLQVPKTHAASATASSQDAGALGGNSVGSATAAAVQSYAAAATAFGADEPEGSSGGYRAGFAADARSAYISLPRPMEQGVIVGVYMYDLNDPRYAIHP